MELSTPVKNIYQRLLEALKSFGEVHVEEKKTSIHLINRVTFAGLHPRKDYLYLEIVSDNPIKNKRVFRVEQISKNRYHNHIKLEQASEIDNELLQLLHSAYNLCI
jgi:hypothetical protein